MRARQLILIVAICSLVTMAGYGVWLMTASSRASAHGGLAIRKASKAEEMLLRSVAAAPPQLHACPDRKGTKLKPSPQTGHHKVILTWNASAPASDPAHDAVGYCLYRALDETLIKNDAQCSNCEQVNQKSVVGTACVDDLAKDGDKYYYVAMAIDATGHLSSQSNDTMAQIPPTAEVHGPVTANSYPRCRANNTP